MSNKLFEIIREKHHLVYNIGCKIERFSHFGLFKIHFNILNDISNIKKSIHHIFEILNHLKYKLLEQKIIKITILKDDNRKVSRNLNALNIGIKRAEFILFNNINTNYFKKTYSERPLKDKYKKSNQRHDNTKKSAKTKSTKTPTQDILNSKNIQKYAKYIFNYKKMGLILISPKSITSRQISYHKLIN